MMTSLPFRRRPRVLFGGCNQGGGEPGVYFRCQALLGRLILIRFPDARSRYLNSHSSLLENGALHWSDLGSANFLDLFPDGLD